MLRCNSLLAALALCLAGVPAAQAQGEAQAEDASQPRLALMGTVPIYWGETAGLAEMLGGDAPPHWARAVLEEQFVLAPLDYLSAETLADYRLMLMAQPRGLSAEENVALDSWVRGGGLLLLFADPMMTGESRFHLGDRRRPQDVTLLSPILARWGLEMLFDPGQPGGPQLVRHMGNSMPVNLRGELAPSGDMQDCRVPDDGLLAHCTIGEGQVLVVADAAMLDIAGPYAHAESALRWMVCHLFRKSGDGAGNSVRDCRESAETRANQPVRHHAPHHDHHEESGNPGQ